MNKLNEEFDIDVSWETIKKDFQEINSESKVIDYSAQRRGYFLNDKGGHHSQFSYSGEQRKALELASAILGELGEIPLLKEFDAIIKKLLKVHDVDNRLKEYFRSIIQLETVPNVNGVDWIGPIFNAIRNGKTIKISYKRFENNSSKSHSLHPYLLKEYRNRWYLIGRPSWSNTPITFSLDRILEVIQEEKDIEWNDFRPEDFYRFSLGITAYESEEILDVKLRVSASQLNYLKTLPLHHSQIIEDENEEFGIVKLRVLYSYELVKEIMGMNKEVLVLEPSFLKNEIIKLLSESLNQYPERTFIK